MTESRARMARRLERGIWILLALTALVYHLVDLGAAPAWRTACSWAAVLLGLGVVLGLGRRCRYWDGPRLGLCALALWLLPGVHTRVGGDGTEYFVVLRSVVIDHDLQFANDFACLGVRPVTTSTGVPTSRFPIGLSLMWAPSFIVTHVLAGVAALAGSGVAVDGCAPPYQAAVTRASFLFGFVGLLVIESLVRRAQGRGLALVATLGLWFATPLHFYMTANPAMSHAASVCAAALLLAAWLHARQGSSWRAWLAVGVAGAFLALVRVQDGVLLLLPALDLLITRRRAARRPLVALLSAPFAAAVLQAGFWLSLYGPGFIAVVQRQGRVARIAPQVVDFLFAARHGLFTWTPLYALAVLGWVLLARRERLLGALTVLGFALSVAVNSAHGDWWGSDSFGQRRLLGLTPFFALGLGEALAFCRRRPLLPLTAIVGALALWNLQFESVFNGQLVADRTQAVTLDRLASEQVEATYRDMLRMEPWLPRPLFVLLYDNLKGVWLDEGPRQMRGLLDLGAEPADLPIVVGHAWYEPETDGLVTYRRCRGRRCWLRIPIRTIDAFELTLRAQRTLDELPVTMTLEMNGTPLGEVALQREWSEASFELPRTSLHPGFNELALKLSAAPRADLADYHGKDSAAAVDWLRFARRGPSPDRPPAPLP